MVASKYPPPKMSPQRLAWECAGIRERAIGSILRGLGVLDEQTRRRVLIAALALYGIEPEDLRL